MAFNSWRAPNSHSYSAPRILVTLIEFGKIEVCGGARHQGPQLWASTQQANRVFSIEVREH
jgi:hypothetical protein